MLSLLGGAAAAAPGAATTAAPGAAVAGAPAGGLFGHGLPFLSQPAPPVDPNAGINPNTELLKIQAANTLFRSVLAGGSFVCCLGSMMAVRRFLNSKPGVSGYVSDDEAVESDEENSEES